MILAYCGCVSAFCESVWRRPAYCRPWLGTNGQDRGLRRSHRRAGRRRPTRRPGWRAMQQWRQRRSGGDPLRRLPVRPARAGLGPAQLHPAADDGRRAVLLRPGGGQVHGRSLSRRPGAALRRHRFRADLAGLSEHRHRQPQPARPAARHARRTAGLRQMVADFHRRGVRVLFPGHALGRRARGRRACRCGSRPRAT